MAYPIRWTRRALSDFVALCDSMATGDPKAADAVFTKVLEAVARLADFPESGRIVPERRAQGYREVIVAPYRVVYAVVGGDVRILRVWHGRVHGTVDAAGIGG